MRTFKWFSFLPLILICIACSKPLPELEGIDRSQWDGDKNACQRLRTSMRNALDQQKEELLSLDQMQMVKLLGRPDVNELYSRNQKFFYYYLEPGPACAGVSDTTAERLVIRFNAVGLAKEVSLE